MLQECALRLPSVSSDFARYWAPQIAAAAGEGLITTREPTGQYARAWRATAYGMLVLEGHR